MAWDCVLTMVLATASSVSAQSILDAGRVEFTPSPQHNAVDSTTGVPIVQSYSLQIFLAGGATPVQTVSLGKPSPESDGMIRVNFLSLLSPPLTPGVIYEAQVAAVGPGGRSASARSNTFAFRHVVSATISPASQSVPAAGGTGSSTVTATTGCAGRRRATRHGSRSARAPRVRNGSVTFSVAANPGTTSRTGTLTIGGNTFTVTQAGAPCAPTISPHRRTSPRPPARAPSRSRRPPAARGRRRATRRGSPSARARAAPATARSATASPRIPARTARTGTLTIGGNTFTVTQAGAPCAPTICPRHRRASPRCRHGHRRGHGGDRLRVDGDEQRRVDHDQRGRDRQRQRHGELQRRGESRQHRAHRHADDRRQHLHRDPGRGAVCADDLPRHRRASPRPPAPAPSRSRRRPAARGRRRATRAWITISAGATGSGNGSVSYSVAANPAAPRAPGR